MRRGASQISSEFFDTVDLLKISSDRVGFMSSAAHLRLQFGSYLVASSARIRSKSSWPFGPLRVRRSRFINETTRENDETYAVYKSRFSHRFHCCKNGSGEKQIIPVELSLLM